MNRDCMECGNSMGDNPVPTKKYCCRTCLVRARNRRNRPKYTPLPLVPAVAAPSAPRLPVFRARTLAETPDVPALATRGDQLTGKAAACCTAGRVVHAHGGAE